LITIPRRNKGRQSAQAEAQFKSSLDSFYRALIEIDKGLPFKVSSRGWCYVLEEYGLTKGDFKSAQDLINDGRKTGGLPIDFTALDGGRAFDCVEFIDGTTPDEEANFIIGCALEGHTNYNPVSFWDYQDFYVELMVEKIDLKSMFQEQCQRYSIPVANAKGWSDINMRNQIIQRFKKAEAKGKLPVLLYCGDFDPAGINISNTIAKNFDDLSQATGWTSENLIIDRFGLNYDFIQDNNLSWVNNLITGSGEDLASPSHKNHNDMWVQDYISKYGVRKVEANALITRIEAGRDLFSDTLAKYLDGEGIRKYEKDLKSERERVAGLVLEKMKLVA
jgi:hypothetical protein